MYSLHYVHSWCLKKPEKGTGSLGTKIMTTVSCHVGSLKEQPVLLTAGPSLQSLLFESKEQASDDDTFWSVI